MLRATIRFLAVLPGKAFHAPRTALLPLSAAKPAFNFGSSGKHDNHEHTHKHGEHNHEGHKQSQKEGHHEHGPGCKHDHGHHHEHHHHEQHTHEHGPNCNHKHDHNDHNHHAAHPNVKLSKLSFEELIELNSEESLKYAHLIYEQEEKKLKALKEEKEHEAKNIEFYRKIEGEVRDKERKIEENIRIYEEEAALSNKRAEKQVEESKTFAVTKIAKELLEVADCITNCKKFAEEAESKDKYLELMIQTQQLVRDILKKYEIEEFDPTNKEYDPNYQESLIQIPTPPGCTTGHVAMTMRTGYLIKGRLLRSARVGVFS